MGEVKRKRCRSKRIHKPTQEEKKALLRRNRGQRILNLGYLSQYPETELSKYNKVLKWLEEQKVIGFNDITGYIIPKTIDGGKDKTYHFCKTDAFGIESIDSYTQLRDAYDDEFYVVYFKKVYYLIFSKRIPKKIVLEFVILEQTVLPLDQKTKKKKELLEKIESSLNST